MLVSFGLASLVGIYLIEVAGWPVILIGVISILAGIAYTGGPLPLGYYGLGDLMVFVFFGPAAVVGTYFVQALRVTPIPVWMSIAVGALATAILVVNNLRDINTDREAGKITLAARLGEAGTRLEYSILISIAYLVPLTLLIIGEIPPTTLLILFSIPLAVRQIRLVAAERGRALNPVLAKTGQLEMIYSILFVAGLNLPAVISP
jgi:1,4-dihydroxy-2-naphthoate octaprenyltransferase